MMIKAIVESGKSGIIIIPQEVLERCEFSPHQEVMIKEGGKFMVVKQVRKESIDPATINVLKRLRIPPGSLAHLATGSGGSGDFDEEDID